MENTQLPQDNHETLKVSTSSDPHHFPKTILLGLTAFLIIITGIGIGYYLGANNNQASQVVPIANQAPSPSVIPEVSISPIPTAKSVIIPSDWKAFTSKICNFNLKTPQYWIVNDTKGTDREGYNFTCTTLVAPDFKITGMDTDEGLRMSIHRSPIFSTFKTLEDYIEVTESIQKPKVPAKNVQNKTYGNFSGKYFEYEASANEAYFIFIQGNYIYTFMWDADYQGKYKNDTEQIVSSLTF